MDVQRLVPGGGDEELVCRGVAYGAYARGVSAQNLLLARCEVQPGWVLLAVASLNFRS